MEDAADESRKENESITEVKIKIPVKVLSETSIFYTFI
jgi:hypothetical protein